MKGFPQKGSEVKQKTIIFITVQASYKCLNSQSMFFPEMTLNPIQIILYFVFPHAKKLNFKISQALQTHSSGPGALFLGYTLLQIRQNGMVLLWTSKPVPLIR